MSTSSTPFTLTPEVAQAAGALASLVTGTCTVPGDSAGRKALTDAEFAARLGVPVSAELPIADWALVRLAPEETLTPYQYGMSETVEHVLSALLANPAFHPQLGAQVATLRGVFVAAALPADGWLTNPRHGARPVLATLYEIACGWQPELGGLAGTMCQEITGWLTALTRSPQPWQATLNAMATWQAGERARTERLEKRLIEAESGALRARRARQVAARTLNQALADRLTGVEIAEALRQDWLPAMQWALLADGEQGQLWQRVKRVTGSLRWTLSPEMGDGDQNRLIRLTAQVTEELATLAPLVLHDEAIRERLLATLDLEHMRILRNQPREAAPFSPVETHEVLADASASLSQTLLADIQGLQTGQWVILHEPAGPRRARLLLRQDDSRQLLFVNALGAKVLQASWESFALRLVRGEATVLPMAPPLDTAINEVIAALRRRLDQSRQSRLETLRVAREQATTEARTREAARQKALAEAQALDAARQDAQRRAADLEVTAQQAAKDGEQQRQQRARLQASSLTTGDWVAFRGTDGQVLHRKLAVLLPSTGKYIFVAVDGTDKRELLRDELVRGFADGSILALGKDQRLQDTLSRVVDNLRNERGTP